jgi:serine/threonine protein kinase
VAVVEEVQTTKREERRELHERRRAADCTIQPRRARSARRDRAVHRVTGRIVAIKSVARASVKAASIYREWSVLESVGSHPYCVAYHGTFKTPTSVDFVLEYLPGGELFERLISCGPLPEAEVRLPIRHLADALAYLHSRGIVHR